MILLETWNRIVEETVRSQVMCGGADVVDVTCADFDGVAFHVSSDANAKGFLLVSISTRCYHTLKNFGVDDRLQKIYGPMFQAQPESNYDATLRIDLAQAPKQPGERHCVCALFCASHRSPRRVPSSSLVRRIAR